MAEEKFDPYRKWLGIPPRDQPPNDYRLLGIETFESDPDVIANAADQRMQHLKGFATGKYSELSQTILNQIAAARVRLLRAEEKTRYDAALRQELLEKRIAERRVHEALAVGQPLAEEPAAEPVQAEPDSDWAGAVDPGASIGISGVGSSTRTHRRQPAWVVPAVLGGATAAAVLLAAVVWLALRDGDDASRADATPPPRRPPGDQQSPQSATPQTQQPESPLSATPSGGPRAGRGPRRPFRPPGSSGQRPRILGDLLHTEEDSPQPGVPDPSGTGPDEADPGPVEPQPQPPPQPKPQPPPQPVPQPEPQPKLPEPDAAERAQIETEIREVVYKDRFEAATTPELKLALAGELSDLAASENKPAERFVLWQLACELTGQAGDLDRALGIADQMADRYEYRPLALKADAAARASRVLARGPGNEVANRELVDATVELADEALCVGDCALATRFLRTALVAARRTKNKERITRIEARGKEVEGLQPRYELVKAALERLQTNADDEEANSRVGYWYCLTAGAWERGLPYLAQCKNKTAAALAARDLAAPETPAEQVKLGDDWRSLGQGASESVCTRLDDHAASWYRRALPRLSGFDKAKVESFLEQRGFSVRLYALKLDGQRSHVVVPFLYSGQVPITLEAIVQPDSQFAASAVFGNVCPAKRYTSAYASVDSHAGLGLSVQGGQWCFRFYEMYKSSVSSSYYYTREHFARAQRPLAPGRWVHLAGVYDLRQATLYVDGRRQGSEAVAGEHKPAVGFPFIVGGDPVAVSAKHEAIVQNLFGGLVAAVRISEGALYAADFEPPKTLTVERPATKLLLVFDKGKGESVADAVDPKVIARLASCEWVELDEKSSPLGPNGPGSSGSAAGAAASPLPSPKSISRPRRGPRNRGS